MCTGNLSLIEWTNLVVRDTEGKEDGGEMWKREE
jgi:hypothetical protein